MSRIVLCSVDLAESENFLKLGGKYKYLFSDCIWHKLFRINIVSKYLETLVKKLTRHIRFFQKAFSVL